MSEEYLKNLANYIKKIHSQVTKMTISELCSKVVCDEYIKTKICYVMLKVQVDNKCIITRISKRYITISAEEGFYRVSLCEFPNLFIRTPDDYYLSKSPKAYNLISEILSKTSVCLE